MEPDVRAKLRELAALVTAINETQQELHGALSTLTAAVSALFATHAAPPELAQALRRAWLRLGEWNSDDASTPAFLRGIDGTLSLLEDASRVPLLIRPPRGDDGVADR